MNRTDVLNHVARITGARSYLEIGVFDPQVNFDRIQCPNKLGVDPTVADHRVVQQPSDEFFDQLKSGCTWDLIFIDGDHTYQQVTRDLENALRHLSTDGVIVMHDVDPESESAAGAIKPSPTAIWSGEVWRVLVERVRPRRDLRSTTVDCDHGVALITRGHNSAPLEIDRGPGWTFSRFQQHRQQVLALIPADLRAIGGFLGQASIVYYTAHRTKRSIRKACFERLRESANRHQLVVVAHREEDFFRRADRIEILGQLKYGYRTLYTQMLHGLEVAHHDTVFLAEDDILYPAGYFDFQLPDRYRFFYNLHSYVANLEGFFATDCHLTSNGVGARDLLAHAVRQRLYHLRSGGEIGWAEPGLGDHDDFSNEVYRSDLPTVDVRHGDNLTGYRESTDYLDWLEPWGSHHDLLATLGLLDTSFT